MYLAAMAEILQSIRQAEITQILTRIQQSEGGAELLDVLMKYLYVGALNCYAEHHDEASVSYFDISILMVYRYRGMAQTAPQTSKTISPQGTGFSQIHSRFGGGESGGQAMSVMLSWHEKVSRV